MKSIREWMVEKGIVEDNISKSIYVRSKDGSLEVDSMLRSRMSQFIDRIKQVEKYKDMPKEELANKIHDAVDAVIADVSGTRISASRAFDNLHASDDQIAREAP